MDVVITKNKLIRNIAKQTSQSIDEAKSFYNSLEDTIFDLLSSVNEKQNIYIKLFNGINLEGKYIPEKTKKNNLTGEVVLIESRIKPNVKITRRYCENLNKQ
jgi:nucleoid DNA-binding protein